MNATYECRILAALVRLEAEVAADKKPPAWRTWDVEKWKADRELGPRWSWVTNEADGDAERMRLTRALRRLEAAGLVACQRGGYSGRVERVKLTAAGKAAAAEAGQEIAS